MSLTEYEPPVAAFSVTVPDSIDPSDTQALFLSKDLCVWWQRGDVVGGTISIEFRGVRVGLHVSVGWSVSAQQGIQMEFVINEKAPAYHDDDLWADYLKELARCGVKAKFVAVAAEPVDYLDFGP